MWSKSSRKVSFMHVMISRRMVQRCFMGLPSRFTRVTSFKVEKVAKAHFRPRKIYKQQNTLTKYSRDCPGIISLLSRDRPEISQEICLCVSHFPKATHKQIWPPLPGQSRKVIYVYWFISPPIISLHEERVRRTANMKHNCAPPRAAPWSTLWALVRQNVQRESLPLHVLWKARDREAQRRNNTKSQPRLRIVTKTIHWELFREILGRLYDPKTLGIGGRGDYKRGLFTGGISRVSQIAKFSRVSRKWWDSPFFSTL